MNTPALDFSFLRNQTVGIDSIIDTPFGKRLMSYCDFTASGRCLSFVEEYIMHIQRHYANTHTEDDITGRNMTHLLHQAEEIIKRSVNAGPHGKIVCIGSGSTAAIYKFQQIVGVALPPATRAFLWNLHSEFYKNDSVPDFLSFLNERKPVVFVGPYEHHSNELTWRESLACVERVRLTTDGRVDTAHLADLLQDPKYADRMKIGSFSAASNVTGIKSPVHEIAAVLHKHNALACFDFAASGPYVNIDMNPESDSNGSVDAVFLSPHKFLGGPGSCGVLVFNDRLYHTELPPSVSGGGTVSYVTSFMQEYYNDIEEREKAGTPGVLQTLKAAMVFDIKDTLTTETIEQREQELLEAVFKEWSKTSNIEILGNPDPSTRIAVVSFNIRDPWGSYLHPKFITALLNDLFGIQSRAGCSCAGPYGHELLGIDTNKSVRYRSCVANGYEGMKPGWCRVGFHYSMDFEEMMYVVQAVTFIAEKGYLFLPAYTFDIKTGAWHHHQEKPISNSFSIEEALNITAGRQAPAAIPAEVRHCLYNSYLAEAGKLAEQYGESLPGRMPVLEGELEELRYFSFVHAVR